MNYINSYTGENLDKKPEHMTSLNTNDLVNKNDKRIMLRGYLDELKAKVLLYAHCLYIEDNQQLLTDVDEILRWVKLLQRVEVTGETIENLTFHELSFDDIREHSHKPKKYYGVDHLFDLPYNANIDLLKINEIRAFVRRIETIAFDTYFIDEKLLRPDFIATLNRLSSVLYIIELKIISGKI